VIKLLNILSEQVSPNSDKLIKGIQSIIDQSLIRMEKETEEMGWYEQPVCLLLKKDNKTFWVYPSRDDEGNDGGALFMSNKEGVMPTLR